MTLNTHVLIARALWEGIAIGLSKALQPSDPPITPDQMLVTLHESAMHELSMIIDFDQQEVATTETFNALVATTEKDNQPTT